MATMLLAAGAAAAAMGGPVPFRGAVPLAQSPHGAAPVGESDVFAYVRALDDAAARRVWPEFSPSGIPLALFDGTSTVLLRHPNPPPEFLPMPGHPGALIAPGRHPAVAGNSTTMIGGVRTATVIATPAQSVDSTTLAVVEELFHVFWLARHPSFRPNELARYAYPVTDVDNLGRLLAEDEALARALDGGGTDEAARWTAAALAIRRERVLGLADDVRAFETALEMMEGTANYVARVAAGKPPARTVDRLRVPRPAEDIRWRFYDTGTALCLLADRLSPGWQARTDRQPDLTVVDLVDAALRGRGVEPAAFSKAETGGFQSGAARQVADLNARRQQIRAELAGRQGPRIIVEVAVGAEPLRVQRFDPINLMVLDAGEMAHANFITLTVPQGTIELSNPGFVRRTFGGTVSLTVPVGPHPLSQGIRRLTIVGIQAAPKAGREGDTITVEAPGVRLTLRGAEMRTEGDQLRITVKGALP